MQTEHKPIRRVFGIIVAILIPLLIGTFSAFLTAEDMKIYGAMEKPFLAPPTWVFPVAWTILYILMGIASYLVFASDAAPERRRRALTFYAAQLIMNFVWPMLFFTYLRYMIALIWLLAMWVLQLVCMILFFRIRRAAGLLIGVLFLWTTFAAYLNLAYYLNDITPKTIVV